MSCARPSVVLAVERHPTSSRPAKLARPGPSVPRAGVRVPFPWGCSIVPSVRTPPSWLAGVVYSDGKMLPPLAAAAQNIKRLVRFLHQGSPPALALTT
jgi:hypothetical protein